MSRGSRGHVFVVHGRLETLVHDAAIVPTDDDMSLRPYWFPLLGTSQVADLEPEALAKDGFGRSADGQPVWFVSVGSRLGLPAEAVVDRAVRAVEAVIECGLAAHQNRVKPLIAMPVVGIQGGGHGHQRGLLIELLLGRLDEVVRSGAADIAVVTPDASVYAAAQHIRRRSSDRRAPVEASRLADLARNGELALFLGAGVSVPAGLPSWTALVDQLVKRSSLVTTDLNGLSALDQAELLERSTTGIGRRVARIIRKHARPSLAHSLLAGLECREVVTTNYDRLYEVAAGATRRPATTVLPWQRTTGRDPWILKMHGDVRRPASIVLTRRHFVRYDATTRPAGSLLQGLLMTRHLLMVGASLNDDNVVRLAHEVQAFREDHNLRGPIGTMLDVDGDSARRALWSKELKWVTFPGEKVAARARRLEIFLDHVARMASDDASWLLDPRFSALLDADERELAEEARALRRRIAGEGGAWSRLSLVLESLGAPDEGEY